jgi:hypothetical protein
MRFFGAILLLGLALTNPGFAADEDGVHPGRRPAHPSAEVARWGEVQPLYARGPGALFTSVEAAAIDALTSGHRTLPAHPGR